MSPGHSSGPIGGKKILLGGAVSLLVTIGGLVVGLSVGLLVVGYGVGKVVGLSVVGNDVGGKKYSSICVGDSVVGLAVVGLAVVGLAVVGLAVVGLAVVGLVVGLVDRVSDGEAEGLEVGSSVHILSSSHGMTILQEHDSRIGSSSGKHG